LARIPQTKSKAEWPKISFLCFSDHLIMFIPATSQSASIPPRGLIPKVLPHLDRRLSLESHAQLGGCPAGSALRADIEAAHAVFDDAHRQRRRQGCNKGLPKRVAEIPGVRAGHAAMYDENTRWEHKMGTQQSHAGQGGKTHPSRPRTERSASSESEGMRVMASMNTIMVGMCG
jgi:hypothetical protein